MSEYLSSNNNYPVRGALEIGIRAREREKRLVLLAALDKAEEANSSKRKNNLFKTLLTIFSVS
jgi:hypothetical protein